MKNRARHLVKATLPSSVTDYVRIAKHRAASRKHYRVAPMVFCETDGVVAQGPFEGLRYPATSSWSVPSPNLVGSYESELHGAWEELIALGPRVVVDVGAADGYYAVGLALRLSKAHIYAFDISLDAQRVCREMAELNDVADRVEVRGECTLQDLEELSGQHTLIIMDCEGAELALLDPVRAPSLAKSVLVVEFHDFVDPRITETLLERVRPSHRVHLVTATKRTPEDWHATSNLRARDARIAVDERRRSWPHPQQWAVMTPR